MDSANDNLAEREMREAMWKEFPGKTASSPADLAMINAGYGDAFKHPTMVYKKVRIAREVKDEGESWGSEPVFSEPYMCRSFNNELCENSIPRKYENGVEVYYPGAVQIQPSGWEPPYETEVWNDKMTTIFFGLLPYVNPHSFQLGTNCYWYAINQKTEGDAKFSFSTWEFSWSHPKTEPGYLSGIDKHDKPDIVDRVSADLKTLNMDFREIAKHDPCSEGGYKVALVLSEKDYHWFRQNPDGTWSHKPGDGEVTNLDYSGNDDHPGKIIYDPQNCDLGEYTFYGFYEIAPKK